MKHRAFNILGNIAVVNFPKEFNLKQKKQFATQILKTNNQIKTVLEKSGKFKGRLRKMQTKHLTGKKTKEVLYKENNCVFRFNIDTTYFSPRLSNERKEIAQNIKKGDEVLVMFAGVAPFSIAIAKNSSAKKVYSNEINREANKYAQLNVELNKVKNKIELVPGDVKKFVEKIGSLRSHIGGSASAFGHDASLKKVVKGERLKKVNMADVQNNSYINNYKKCRGAIATSDFPKTFDVIVMPRPNLKETFLREAFKLSKKGTRIFYYDFCAVDEIKDVVEKIKQEAERAKKKIKILKTKKAGEIAPYKIRCRIDLRVGN